MGSHVSAMSGCFVALALVLKVACLFVEDDRANVINSAASWFLALGALLAAYQ